MRQEGELGTERIAYAHLRKPGRANSIRLNFFWRNSTDRLNSAAHTGRYDVRLE